jgi:hypothetical protein
VGGGDSGSSGHRPVRSTGPRGSRTRTGRAPSAPPPGPRETGRMPCRGRSTRRSRTLHVRRYCRWSPAALWQSPGFP